MTANDNQSNFVECGIINIKLDSKELMESLVEIENKVNFILDKLKECKKFQFK